MKLNRFAQDLLKGRWVEIMRAGTWNRTTFTVDDLKKIAEDYDSHFRVAPLVIGHPSLLEVEGERAAHGVIADLRVVADSLQARIENLSDEVRAGLQSGKWISRSIEAMKFGKGENRSWYLTGLALLGGSQPAVDAMLSEDSEKCCIDCDAPESKSPEIETNESTPTNNKGASKMDATELKRLEDVEKKLDAQVGEFKTLQSSLTALTDSVTQLSTSIGELTKLKTDYDALSASTTALVDAQAQLAVNEATKGIPKALCSDEKKTRLAAMYKTDRTAFDDEVKAFNFQREKFTYLTKEVVTDDAGDEVVHAEIDNRERFSAESLAIADKIAQLKAANPKLSDVDAAVLAHKEVRR